MGGRCRCRCRCQKPVGQSRIIPKPTPPLSRTPKSPTIQPTHTYLAHECLLDHPELLRGVGARQRVARGLVGPDAHHEGLQTHLVVLMVCVVGLGVCCWGWLVGEWRRLVHERHASNRLGLSIQSIQSNYLVKDPAEEVGRGDEPLQPERPARGHVDLLFGCCCG